jgi:hypothetical protein
MSLRAVFLVKSPLQFLNALEARHAFGLAADECLLVLMADRKSRNQLSALVENDNSGWFGVQWLAQAPLRMAPGQKGEAPRPLPFWRNDIFNIFKLRSLARASGALGYVFVGDAGNPAMRHFASCARTAEVVLLDDGVATIKYARWRFSGTWGEGIRRSKKINQFLKRALLGLRDSLPAHLTFFSVYNFEVLDSDRHVSNQFSYLREKSAALALNDDVFFLGGPLVEAGILQEEEYFWHLQRACEYLSGASVRYVAHRRENPERIKRIEKTFGWQSVLFDYPIEYQLACVGPRPSLLASFISSALENCQTVFGDDLPIVSFRFNPEHFSAQDTTKGRDVGAVYERYLASSGSAFVVRDL